MDILIGFEFEFGWKRISNRSYEYDFQVFNRVKKEIKKELGNDFFKNIHDVVTDGSLSFAKKEGDICGVEVVTKPMEESFAIEFCKAFLKWMKKENRVITNSTCSLHVNLNFKNKKINEKIDYFSLLQKTPEKLILEMFGRQKNQYCIASVDKKFGLRIKNKVTPRHTIDYWLKKIGDRHLNTVLRNNHPHLYKKNPYKGKKETIFFKSEDEFLEIVKESYIERVEAESKGTAVVEKRGIRNSKYYEFRMVGNANYERRYSDIKKSIIYCKKALIKSVVDL